MTMERATVICAWVICAVIVVLFLGRFVVAPLALHVIVWMANIAFPPI